MKRFLSFSLFLVCMISISYAQDIVYLTDGSFIQGTVVEIDPTNSVKIETLDGKISVIAISKVEHIGKEDYINDQKEISISNSNRKIDRRGGEYYWDDNGEKLTLDEYTSALDGDLYITFRSAQKQFSNGNSLLFGGVALAATACLFYYSYLSTAHVDAISGIAYFDQSKYTGFQLSAWGADICLCTGFIFRGIGKGRLEWVKNTYNSGRNTASRATLSPSLMMTAQRDMGLGATLSFSF